MTSSSIDKPLQTSTSKFKAHPLDLSLLKLTFIALAMQMIYVTYIVAFPLISNTLAGGPAADLEILMRDDHWFAPLYTLGVVLLYVLFWQAMKIVLAGRWQVEGNPEAPIVQPVAPAHMAVEPGRPDRMLKLFVLAFGLVFGFTLIWLYPITANDLFRYVVRGRVWAVHDASPLISPPSEFPDDPYLDFAGEFEDLASGYGPLWELLVQVPLRLGATDMVPAVVGLKLIILLCYLGCAILIGWVVRPEKSSSLAALTFFAWNPLIMMQALGNGHNDMVFLALLVLGIVCWQRGLWWAAAFALTLSALAKAPAAMILPLFAVILLREEPTWRQRLLKAFVLGLIGLITVYLVYAAFGPVRETMEGLSNTVSLSRRGGFSIAAGLRMVLREIIPVGVAETLPRTTGRYIFLIVYAGLLLQLWRHKFNLVTAGFLVFFSQLILWRTFRIWYPTWLIPLAAIHLTPATFWRTTLFGLTAELSLVNYFVVWRWELRDLPWEKLGLVTTNYYWTVMHILTVPWVFGLPLFGPILMRWVQQRKSSSEPS